MSIIEANVKMEVVSPCSFCKHKFDNAPGCWAFPDEIPMEILKGKDKHLRVHSKQKNKIVFERIKE